MSLDIGCGGKKKGDVGIDVRRTRAVDIIADARMLPFRHASFNRVYSGDVIEHFDHKEIRKLIIEWLRVLKKEGALEIVCPDLRARSLLFFLNPTWQNVENIYGEQDYPSNYHKCGFSFGLLKSLLESCGINKVKRIISGHKGIPFIPDCLHVIGHKC